MALPIPGLVQISGLGLQLFVTVLLTLKLSVTTPSDASKVSEAEFDAGIDIISEGRGFNESLSQPCDFKSWQM